MNIRTVVGGVALFAAGIAVGYFCLGGARGDKVDASDARDRNVASPSYGVKADGSAELKAAQEKIARLERQIASLSARPKEPLKEKPEDEESKIVIDGSQTNLEEVLAKKLSADDLQKVKDAFERMRQARAKRAQGKREFLESIDMSKASKAERKTHDAYLKLVAEQEELMGKVKGFIPDQETIGKLVELQMKSKPLADAERKTLLRQMSANLGYAGDDADVVVGTVEDIVGATSGGGIGDALNSITEGFGGMGGDDSPVGVQVQTLSL